MEYGKPRARKASRLAFGALAAFAIAASAMAAAALVSCGKGSEAKREAAFASALAALDARIGSGAVKGLDAAYSLGIKSARSTSDWLCLLKRSRLTQAMGDGGRYAQMADRALRAFPKSEPLSAAAAHAYLRNGSAQKALALFAKSLSIDARPRLWAEAFLASMRLPGFKAESSDYGMLADITQDPEPFIGAAVLALSSGDKIAGAAWLRKAIGGGAAPPADLLWDCGLYSELASRSDAAADSRELAMMGDAAWMSGDGELAKRRWTRSIALRPTLSWKPYANLALLSGEASETAASYWARIRSAFLASGPSTERDGALGAYASHLARAGRGKEALAALVGGGRSSGAYGSDGRLATLELAIRGEAMPEGRYAAELEALAARLPDDASVIGAALKSLSVRGMYGEAAVLMESAARRKLPLEYGWFYEAELLAARGDYPGAVKALRGGAGASRLAPAAAAGPYALGCVYSTQGDAVQAAALFSQAAEAAGSGSEKCAAFKAQGRELGKSGDSAGAAKAFKRALNADPQDAEAALLARSLAAQR